MTECHPFHILHPQQALPLRRCALKLTSCQHRADDLMQATLLQAWEIRDSYRSESNLRAWLLTILRNTFLSELRKFRREVEDADGPKANALSEEPRQDHALEPREVISAIALLPCDQRRSFVLTGAYGYSELEVADACGCPVGTVKSRVSRARAVLDHAFVGKSRWALPALPPASGSPCTRPPPSGGGAGNCLGCAPVWQMMR